MNTTCSIGDRGPIPCPRGVVSGSGRVVGSGVADEVPDCVGVAGDRRASESSAAEHAAAPSATTTISRWKGEVDRSTRSGTLHGTIDLWRRELVVPSHDDGDVLVAGEDLRCGADDLEVT
jgi:hypothetical protein